MSDDVSTTARHATKANGRRWLRIAALSLLAVSAFGITVAKVSVAQLEGQITTPDIDPLLGPDRPERQGNPNDPSAGSPVNILLMGSDSRQDGNDTIGGYEDGKRNDTTLLMHISADRTRVDVVSIPRDTMVQLSECERSDGTTQKPYFGMFNESFQNGARTTGLNADGAACTIRTVEALTGIGIDHFAVIDFNGFVAMVDAIDGVPMCIEEDYDDDFSGTHLTAGPQTLDGSQAVAYVRMRHGTNTDGSDLERIDRQQQFLKNFASKVLSADMLFRPQDIADLVSAVASSLTTDPQLGDIDGYLIGLAFSLRNLDPGTGIVMATAPVETYPADHYKVQFSGKAEQVWAAILADQPIAPLLDGQSNSPANDVQVAAPPTAPTASASPDATEGSAEPDIEQAIFNACVVEQ